MKSRLLLTNLIFLALFSGLFMVSCQKEQSQNGTEEEQQMQASKVSSESDGEAELVFDGLFDDAMGVNTDVGVGMTGIFERTLACPDITITHTTANYFPARVVIDFGPVGCIKRNHLRRGKIIIEYTNRLMYPDALAVTTFDGYYIDSLKVEGTLKIKNTTLPGTQNVRQFTIDVVNAKLSKPNGDYTLWNSHHVMTQYEGVLTNIPGDDFFRIEAGGVASGTTKRGNLISRWESTIIEPLIRKYFCRWIMRGKIRTVRMGTAANGPWVAVLDFGANTCDPLATITINGRIHQITLP